MRELLTVEQMVDLHERGLIGTLEFRTWLAMQYSEFDQVHDSDVDDSIRRVAEIRNKTYEQELAAD